MQSTTSATKARKNFFHLIEQAGSPGASVTITVDGEPRIVMMSSDEFEGWKESLEIMADKKLMKSIREGLKGKKIYSHDEIKKEFGIH